MRLKPNFRDHILPESATFSDAMRTMSKPDVGGIILVADSREKLIGVVVDSDLRKAMLRGAQLDAPLSKAVNRRPFTLPKSSTSVEIDRAIAKNTRAYIPLLDPAGRVRGMVESMRGLAAGAERPNWVALLVGGFGSRLSPLTQTRPKPLLPVGNKPILETIVEQFVSSGFTKFIFAIRHQGEQIRDHFGDGSSHGASIHYIVERKELGTAGALSLIRRRIEDPIIVMNGDVLTKVDFQSMLDFHKDEKCAATVGVREYSFQVPYGVVKMNRHHLTKIEEKPTQSFFVNAGIYILSPDCLKLIPKNLKFDMPELLEKIRRRQPRSVGCFPIREYWIDIGRLPDYQKAQQDFGKHF